MDAFCSPKAKPGSALQAANNTKPQGLTAPAAKAPATAQKTQQNAVAAATPAVKPPAPPKTTSEKASAPEAPPAETSKTQKKKVAQGTWSSSVRRQLEKADARAATALEADDISTEAVERVLAGIAEWPTQARPNVSPDAKAVTGMCLGAVNVLGGVGMQLSAVSQNFQNLVKLVCAWTTKELPDFPFSSLQINYNYAVARGVPRRLPLSPRGDGVEMERRRGDGVERRASRAQAKKHVDGNNIGPSHIISLGDHAGGELWVADTFVEKENDKGEKVLRGGGGESVIKCHRAWKLFDGNSEHYTMPFRASPGKAAPTRISIVAFSHSSYNKMPEETAREMKALGFTAGSSDGKELPYFEAFRIDKSELTGEGLDAYFALRDDRKKARPPPSAPGAVGVECNGYSAGKGAGWFSFVRGRAAKKARIDSFFKPKAPAATRGPVTWDAPKRTNPVSTNLEVKPTVDDAGLVTIQLPKNRVGLWFLELEEKGGGLRCVALERFDLYNKVEAQAEAFHAHVARMPAGRVALVSITDTAMAKTRPLPKLVYDTLRLLGGEAHIEPIGYRMPFGFVGVRGAAAGTAICALDKTKVILRLEGSVVRRGDGVALDGKSVERFDITEHILSSTDGDGAAA